MIPSRSEKTPHIKDEIRATVLVNKLSFAQCEELYKKIRFRNRKQALEIIQEGMSNQPLGKFLQFKGLRDVKIIRIAAAFEIARRIVNQVLKEYNKE